ncbi:MAG TPA: META domain-containing protein [Chloroflexota bacterium]|nr:META domain-containing protein [Chloroflexota bacterium]
MSFTLPPAPATGTRLTESIGAGSPRPPRLTRRVAGPASLAVLALAGGALRGSAAPAAAAATLEGTPWLAVSCVDPAGWFRPLPPGIEITATFQAGQVAGLAGCNQYTAGYQLAQGVAGIVRIGPAAATQRFCADPPGVMEQEAAYLRTLERVGRFHLVGERLVLQALDWSPLVLYVPQPQSSLEGTEWVALDYNNGRGAVVSILLGTEITARFAEGLLSGSAGCNRYNAGYTLGPAAGALSISPAAATRIFCAEPVGVMEQEMEYLAALETAARYRIEGAQLILEQSDGARVATYDARAT